jgi:hypothetical protein
MPIIKITKITVQTKKLAEEILGRFGNWFSELVFTYDRRDTRCDLGARWETGGFSWYSFFRFGFFEGHMAIFRPNPCPVKA